MNHETTANQMFASLPHQRVPLCSVDTLRRPHDAIPETMCLLAHADHRDLYLNEDGSLRIKNGIDNWNQVYVTELGLQLWRLYSIDQHAIPIMGLSQFLDKLQARSQPTVPYDLHAIEINRYDWLKPQTIKQQLNKT